jgi:ABC-type metal ion transport system substrate-binding protein
MLLKIRGESKSRVIYRRESERGLVSLKDGGRSKKNTRRQIKRNSKKTN